MPSYFAKQAIKNIPNLYGPSLYMKINYAFRALLCWVFGHKFTKDRWHKIGDWNNGEWHYGCRRCRYFRVFKD